METFDLRGTVPESWACIDCRINTAPGFLNREQTERAFARDWNKNFLKSIRSKIWEAAGMEPKDGCLCIGCLEKRLGRALSPNDFLRGHPFNVMPWTARLLERRDGD